MKAISNEALAAKLSKGSTAVLLLTGKDAYLREALREQVIASSIDQATRGWAVARFSAEGELGQALAQCRTMPMLARRQVVIVSELEALEELPEETREAEVEMLTNYVADPAPFTVLVLEAAELDQRTKLSKILLERALTVSTELPQDPAERERVAANMAIQIAEKQNASIEKDAAEELAELCNCDLEGMRTEIEKLATYVGPGKAIKTSDVEALVVSDKKYSVWEFAEVLATRNRERALQFLANVLQQGEPAPALVGTMAWMFRKLLEVQQLSPHTSAFEVAGRLQMRRPTAELALRHARRIPKRQLVRGMRALYDADSQLKGGVKDHRALMEFVVAELTRGEPQDQSRSGRQVGQQAGG